MPKSAQIIVFLLMFLMVSPAWAQEEQTYTKEEILAEVEGFFADTTKDLAQLVEKAFAEQGRPVGFIKGEEAGGAWVVGLRYGQGALTLKSGATRTVYWQGPSVGFDFGGNASKVFTLVYRLTNPSKIYQRFPGVDGSAYLVGGFGMTYLKSNEIILAPIQTGVGLRLGANVGYLHFTPEKHVNPF